MTKLAKEDFPGQAAWIDRLLLPLNTFMETSTNTLSNALVEGVSVQFAELNIKTGASVADSFPLYIRVTMRKRPRSVTLAQIENLEDASTFTTAVTPTWRLSDRGGSAVIEIRYITGLATSAEYRVVLEAKG